VLPVGGGTRALGDLWALLVAATSRRDPPVGSFQSRSERERERAARCFACAPGALHLDTLRLAPPVLSLTSGVLLGELRRSFQSVGNPQVQSSQVRSPAPTIALSLCLVHAAILG
jgi:hypothetical protein